MTILFSYVLHVYVFCTTANMNPELPKLLTAPFKHPLFNHQLGFLSTGTGLFVICV